MFPFVLSKIALKMKAIQFVFFPLSLSFHVTQIVNETESVKIKQCEMHDETPRTLNSMSVFDTVQNVKKPTATLKMDFQFIVR